MNGRKCVGRYSAWSSWHEWGRAGLFPSGGFIPFLGLTWDAVRGSVHPWKKSCIPKGPSPPGPIRHFVPRIRSLSEMLPGLRFAFSMSTVVSYTKELPNPGVESCRAPVLLGPALELFLKFFRVSHSIPINSRSFSCKLTRVYLYCLQYKSLDCS